MKHRSIATVILLTFVTCGIYGLWWVYTTAEELDREVGEPGKFSPVVLIVLCLLAGVVGYALFGMQMNDSLNKIREHKGLSQVDNQVLYIVLGLFIPIVLIVLVQNEINKLDDESL